MADVNKVQGPGTPDPLGSGGKKEKVPSDQFKKIMKVEKVRETDPEEQRKRRERAEKEEETDIEEEGGAPTPKDLVTPFSLEQGEPGVSPLDMQTPAAKPSSIPSAPPSAPSPMVSFTESAGPPPPTEEATPPAETSTPQTTQAAPTGATPSQPAAPAEPSSTAASQVPPPTPQETAQKSASQPFIPVPGAPEEIPLDEDKETFFKTFASPQAEEAALEQTIEEEAELPIAPLPFMQPSQAPALEKEEEQKDEGILPLSGIEGAAPLAMQGSLEALPTPIPPYAQLSPQVFDLFERMAGVMTVMTESGVTETTIHLNAEQFASSVFYGSQIIIKEYSTAPREFNIQFNTTTQGAPLFQANVDDLLAAFQSANYNFKIRRVETNIVEKPYLFRRREGPGGEAGGGKQGTT